MHATPHLQLQGRHLAIHNNKPKHYIPLTSILHWKLSIVLILEVSFREYLLISEMPNSVPSCNTEHIGMSIKLFPRAVTIERTSHLLNRKPCYRIGSHTFILNKLSFECRLNLWRVWNTSVSVTSYRLRMCFSQYCLGYFKIMLETNYITASDTCFHVFTHCYGCEAT